MKESPDDRLITAEVAALAVVTEGSIRTYHRHGSHPRARRQLAATPWWFRSTIENGSPLGQAQADLGPPDACEVASDQAAWNPHPVSWLASGPTTCYLMGAFCPLSIRPINSSSGSNGGGDFSLAFWLES